MLHVSRDLAREKVDYKDSPAAKNKQKLLTHILAQLHAYTHKHTPHTNTHTHTEYQTFMQSQQNSLPQTAQVMWLHEPWVLKSFIGREVPMYVIYKQ